MSTTVAWLLFLALLLLVSAVSCVADALRTVPLDRLRARAEHSGRPGLFAAVLEERRQTYLVLRLLRAVAVAAAVWLAAVRDLPGFLLPPDAGTNQWIFAGLRIIAAMFVLIVIWIILPSAVAAAAGERLIIRFWPLLRLLTRQCRLLTASEAAVSRILHRVFEVPLPDDEDDETPVSRELAALADAGRHSGTLQPAAARMIRSVVGLQQETAASIMTPRTDMFCIPQDMSVQEARLEMVREGYSRVPVIGDSVDDVRGILYARDLLTGNSEDEAKPVSSRTRPAIFVPETQEVDDLLDTMRQKHVHLAVVVDEYSGVSGVVTMEDILEEIVGDIADEYDDETAPDAQLVSDDTLHADARCHIDDLNEAFQLGLPEDEDYDTIGGFCLAQFGYIPSVGEQTERDELSIEVLAATDRQIVRVAVRRRDGPLKVTDPQGE